MADSKQSAVSDGSCLIIGTDGYRYIVNHKWAKIPGDIRLGYTHGITEDAHGRIYIHNQSKNSVVILCNDGEYIDSFGEQFAAGAHGMLLNVENGVEYLYFTDYELKLMIKTTLDGEEVMRIDQPDRSDIYKDASEYLPTTTAVASNGDIYIADGYGKSYIHRFEKDGRYIQSFIDVGDDLGKLNCPHGLMIDTRSGVEKLLVCDRINERLVYFSLEGELLSIVSDDIRRPCSTVVHDDELYIPDLYSRLTILDKDDRMIGHVGERENAWEIEGWPNVDHAERLDGKFSSPHDLHVDAVGNIYVVEWVEDGRVTKLTRQ